MTDIETLELRIDELCAEVAVKDIIIAQLRGTIQARIESDRKAKRHLDGIRQTESENERLRTLVRGLIVCGDTDADARECPLYDEGEEFRCRKETMLAELGFEVPDVED